MKKLTIKNIRHFNEIKVFENKYVIKSFIGDDEHFKNKFFNEIIWLIKAQKTIPNLVPKVEEYSLNKDNLWVKYEFIDAQTIHDIFLNNEQKGGVAFWEAFVLESKKMFENFQKIKPKMFVTEEWINNICEYSLKRPLEAIKKLKNYEKFNLFFKKDFVVINNKKYPSLQRIVDFLETKIKSLTPFGPYDKNDCFSRLIAHNVENRICFAHLDLVFGNIFFNSLNNQIKIIDPRGSYINSMDYGDIYYDYAKYVQSIYGLYEFIAEDRYEIDINIKKLIIDYDIEKPYDYEKIKKSFDVFFEGKDFEVFKLIESFQFFTMIPAHSDNYKRQLVELCVGIQHFYEVVGDQLWK